MQVEDLPRNGSVKLVKLKMDRGEGKDTASFHLASSVATETTGSQEVKGGPSTSAPKKAGKRERVKKTFTSLFTRAPYEEDKEKEDSDSEDEMTNQNQDKQDNKSDVQLKLVDMGGHSATTVLASPVNTYSKTFSLHTHDRQGLKQHPHGHPVICVTFQPNVKDFRLYRNGMAYLQNHLENF